MTRGRGGGAITRGGGAETSGEGTRGSTGGIRMIVLHGEAQGKPRDGAQHDTDSGVCTKAGRPMKPLRDNQRASECPIVSDHSTI